MNNSSSTVSANATIIYLPGSRREVTVLSDVDFTAQYAGKTIQVKQLGTLFFARSLNPDGSVFGPTVRSSELDTAISKAEDGIDWVNGERSVLFEHLDIPTVKLPDGRYESHVVGTTGELYPPAQADTVQMSKVLAANNWTLRRQVVLPFQD